MGNAGQPVRVLIVAAMRVYREGLMTVLGRVPGMTVVGAESQAQGVVERLPQWMPDVVLLDMTVLQSHALARQVAGSSLPTAVVALAVDEFNVHLAMSADVPVAAYLTRDASLEELVSIVQQVARAETQARPRLAAVPVHALDTLPNRDLRETYTLTRREREIVSLLDRNLT